MFVIKAELFDRTAFGKVLKEKNLRVITNERKFEDIRFHAVKEMKEENSYREEKHKDWTMKCMEELWLESKSKLKEKNKPCKGINQKFKSIKN